LRPSKALSRYCLTGSLAQLVERFVYTEDVGSSSLSRPTIFPPYLYDYSYFIDQNGSKL
jgi:hypothetical protein